MRRVAAVTAVAVCLLSVVACSEDEAEGPARVLLVGDSVMNQTAQPLRRFLAADVDVRNEAVNGSGLLTPWRFDWPAHLDRVLTSFEPDVVVFLFVGNYTFGGDQRYTTEDGTVIRRRGTPAFFEAWQREAAAMTEAVGEAEVIWVLPPPMRGRRAQAVVEGLREGYEAVADGDDSATTVDAYDVLARDGRFIARASGEDGVRLRAGDGVHLAPRGARRLAGLIEDAVDTVA